MKDLDRHLADLEGQVFMLNGKVDQMISTINDLKFKEKHEALMINDFLDLYKKIDSKLRETFDCSISQLMNEEVKNNE